MDLDDQLGHTLIVVFTFAALTQITDPREVVGAIGDQYPAQQMHAEPAAPRVNELKALPRQRVMDQRFCCLTQDFVLPTQV